jgi:hypothetical protein
LGTKENEKYPPPTLAPQNLKEEKSRHFECMLQPTHWPHVFLVFKTVGHHIWSRLMAGAEIEQGRKTNKWFPVRKLFPDALLRMFPIAPGFYPVLSAQSSIPMDIN